MLASIDIRCTQEMRSRRLVGRSVSVSLGSSWFTQFVEAESMESNRGALFKPHRVAKSVQFAFFCPGPGVSPAPATSDPAHL